MIYKIDAIIAINPDAQVSIDDNDYDTIIWGDTPVIPLADIEAKITELQPIEDAKEQAKINNILKKGDLILTGAYGFPVPINEKKVIEVTSSAFGDVKAIFY